MIRHSTSTTYCYTSTHSHVLTLVKIVYKSCWTSFLYLFSYRNNTIICSHLTWRIHYVSICNILSMNRTSSFYHWKLLSIQVLIRIGCESTWCRFLDKLLIILTSGQIWEFFLSLTKFFVIFLFIWINPFDLICASYFDFSTISSHVIRMFTILRKRISKSSSHTWLGQWSCILLLKQIFLFS